MSAVVSLAGAALRGASRISPNVAARLALALMMRVGSRLGVRDEQRATHEAAVRSDINVNGKRASVYEWGRGPRTVLLVHGWRGRAAQFAALVRELRAEGFAVVAFDAPGNGESAGRTTNAFEYADAIAQLERRYGGLHAIVGHSFGALAAFVALGNGVQTRRLVTIAGVPDAEFLLSSFAHIVRLPEATTDALKRRFVRRICGGSLDVFHSLSGVRNPAAAHVPLLLVHDRDDAQVPASAAHALAAAAIGPAAVLDEWLRPQSHSRHRCRARRGDRVHHGTGRWRSPARHRHQPRRDVTNGPLNGREGAFCDISNADTCATQAARARHSS